MADLAGVFDADGAGGAVFFRPRSLIVSVDIEAVIIASPDSAHAELSDRDRLLTAILGGMNERHPLLPQSNVFTDHDVALLEAVGRLTSAGNRTARRPSSRSPGEGTRIFFCN
jgi:hypothetical protein